VARRVGIVGAGAAGTMAAIFAARAGAETILLERTADGGRKVLISGGGRCNILPARLDETRFVTDSSPNTLRKIVRSWPLAEQIRFFDDELGLALVEETESGKLFPRSNRARDVRDGLLALAIRHGASLRMGARVSGIAPLADARWRIEIDDAELLDVDAVIVASGGLSVPKTGSDGVGLRIARELGHSVHETYAALTPVTSRAERFTALSGISLPVTLSARSAERSAIASGGFLFTHRGYSGPAVLDVSLVAGRCTPGGADAARLTVHWANREEQDWLRALSAIRARTVLGVLREALPERHALVLIADAGLDPARSIAELRRDDRTALIEMLVRAPLPWAGDEGYAKAEVTGGGVSLAEIDPRTMESRLHRNLFLCGELLDAFGPIGGYNFLWAWATGRAAGMGAADARE
jgi:predicted Rossmann fold flavoprotein